MRPAGRRDDGGAGACFLWHLSLHEQRKVRRVRGAEPRVAKRAARERNPREENQYRIVAAPNGGTRPTSASSMISSASVWFSTGAPMIICGMPRAIT